MSLITIRLLLPPHLDERVDHVLLDAGQQPVGLEVLIDDRVEETIDLAEDAAPAGGGAGEDVGEPCEPRRREEVLEGEAPQHPQRLVHHALEAAPLELRRPVHLAERHRADDAVGERVQLLGEVDGGARRGRAGDGEGGHEAVHLGGPGVGEGLDAPHAEELQDEELAHLAPVVAVGAEGHVQEVVAQHPGT